MNFTTKLLFYYKKKRIFSHWVKQVITNHTYEVGEINYIFCNDAYLHKLNVEFLQHDTLTDVISFDTSSGTIISGDIFISIERVKENAKKFQTSFKEELHRVMIHGILHYLGFKDKTEQEKKIMRTKENECLKLLHDNI